jgi:diguanylate cyclase (GGDEF)-like protein
MRKLLNLTLGGRFTLATTMVVVILIVVSLLLINALRNIETVISEKSHQLVTNMSANAEITRSIYRLSSRVQLLEQTYLFNNDILIRENLLIDNQLQTVKSLSSNSEFINRMEVFIQSFHRFLGGSLSLNRILHERNGIDEKLGGSIDKIEFFIEDAHLNEEGVTAQGDFLISHIAISALRENYLNAARISVSIRSRITPDTEKVLLIDLEKELNSLTINLHVMRLYGGDVAIIVDEALGLVNDYIAVLRKMQANLFQRWKVMDVLFDAQAGLIDYMVKNEADVLNHALDVEVRLKKEIVALKWLVVLVAVLIVFSSIIGFGDLVRRHIKKPLNAVIRGINNFDAGQFKQGIQLNRSDEWNTIEMAFNNMAHRLNDTYEALIEERRRLEFIAHHDTLTGLSNRLFVYKKLDLLIKDYHANANKFSLIYLDLDQFKQVNDSLGHDVGDALLREIANILTEIIGDAGDVTRLGGDEFMVLFSNANDVNIVNEYATQLNQTLQKKINVGNFSVVVGSSIGVCHFPEHGDSVDVLIRNADTAMYAAKNMGGNNICVYQQKMTAEIVDITQKISGIRRAIKEDEFFVVYQPQFNLINGDIVGVEALVRWQHPEQGVIPPNDFLPVAEDAGLIGAIDGWVFHNVALQIMAWKQSGAAINDIKVSVNFSGRKFVEPNLIDNLAHILSETGCQASMIEIEITEQDFMTRVEDRGEIMQKLKNMGFSLAIDDFGTGYSSFSYLKYLPVDTLKIDASFIKDITYGSRDMTIVKTMASLSSMLGLKVVAEGIETDEQKNLLREYDESIVGQGYLLARPLCVDDFTTLLRSNVKSPFLKQL